MVHLAGLVYVMLTAHTLLVFKGIPHPTNPSSKLDQGPMDGHSDRYPIKEPGFSILLAYLPITINFVYIVRLNYTYVALLLYLGMVLVFTMVLVIVEFCMEFSIPWYVTKTVDTRMWMTLLCIRPQDLIVIWIRFLDHALRIQTNNE